MDPAEGKGRVLKITIKKKRPYIQEKGAEGGVAPNVTSAITKINKQMIPR